MKLKNIFNLLKRLFILSIDQMIRLLEITPLNQQQVEKLKAIIKKYQK